MPHSEGARGYELLPDRYPAFESLRLIPLTIKSLVDELSEYSENERKAVLWTLALEHHVESTGIANRVPDVQMITYGFTNPASEPNEPSAFGAIVYIGEGSFRRFVNGYRPGDGPCGVEYEREWEDQPQDDLNTGEVPRGIVIEGVTFPYIYRRWQIDFHALSVNPLGGTAACWATKKRRLTPQALLTAKHILNETAVGRPIPLTSGLGKLLAVAPEGIDAALVQLKQGSGAARRPLRSKKLIAQWSDAIVHTQRAVFQTKVIEVNSSRGSLHYSLPLRIFLQDAALPGDSGSLVCTPSGVGIGIYMGSVVNPATKLSEGFCQHLGQAASALQADLWL